MTISVSVLCATYNRQQLIPLVIHQFNCQNYPNADMELIILDDSDHPCFFESHQNNIKYFYMKEKQPIGKKRNLLNDMASGDYIVWFDDDDFYTRDRITKSIDALSNHSEYKIIGVKNMVVYDSLRSKLSVNITFKRPGYTQNNIMAYHRDYLQTHRYKDDDIYDEERFFTNGFTEPCYQFVGSQLCIHIAHSKNTISKDRFLKNKNRIDYFEAELFMNDVLFCEYINKHLNTEAVSTFHWINMDKDDDRKEFMIEQFDKHKLKHARFGAVSSSNIGKSYNIKYHNKLVKNTSINEVCCFASHLSVMNKALASACDTDTDSIIILEDDIIFKDTIINLDNMIINAPPDWEVLQFHHIRLGDKHDYSKALWIPWTRRHFCTTFYVIKKHCAESLVKQYMRFDDEGGISYDLSSCRDTIQADYYIYKDFKTYTLTRQVSESNLEFESNIQSKDWNIKKKYISAFEQDMKEHTI
jgi:GR25 family glycosyltransferase involved in LPS biosynthesis